VIRWYILPTMIFSIRCYNCYSLLLMMTIVWYSILMIINDDDDGIQYLFHYIYCCPVMIRIHWYINVNITVIWYIPLHSIVHSDQFRYIRYWLCYDDDIIDYDIVIIVLLMIHCSCGDDCYWYCVLHWYVVIIQWSCILILLMIIIDTDDVIRFLMMIHYCYSYSVVVMQ